MLFLLENKKLEKQINLKHSKVLHHMVAHWPQNMHNSQETALDTGLQATGYMQISHEIWATEAAQGAATTLDDTSLEWLCLFKKL